MLDVCEFKIMLNTTMRQIIIYKKGRKTRCLSGVIFKTLFVNIFFFHFNEPYTYETWLHVKTYLLAITAGYL